MTTTDKAMREALAAELYAAAREALTERRAT